MNKVGVFVAIAVVFAIAGVWYWQPDSDTYFIDSTPLHGEVYAAPPINVTLNFNTDLIPDSSMTVRSRDGRQWQTGNVTIEDLQTALQVSLKENLPDGQYTIDYQACFVDQSCEHEDFSFSIDSSKQSGYQDLRNQPEVTISLREIAFAQPKIIISPGTRVTWVNHDSVGHYVNTETHPEHTYFPAQNSREITPGKSFSTTFTIPGQYNYHCSAHVPEGMLGSIIVDKR